MPTNSTLEPFIPYPQPGWEFHPQPLPHGKVFIVCTRKYKCKSRVKSTGKICNREATFHKKNENGEITHSCRYHES